MVLMAYIYKGYQPVICTIVASNPWFFDDEVENEIS